MQSDWLRQDIAAWNQNWIHVSPDPFSACDKGVGHETTLIVVGTKVARSWDLGVFASCKHNKSVDICEKLVSGRFELLNQYGSQLGVFFFVQHACGLPTAPTLLCAWLCTVTALHGVCALEIIIWPFFSIQFPHNAGGTACCMSDTRVWQWPHSYNVFQWNTFTRLFFLCRHKLLFTLLHKLLTSF